MTQAIFITDFPPSANLPPMEDLQYIDEDGVLQGGYSCVGHVPSAVTAMVWVDTSDAMIATMKTDPRYFYLEDATILDEPKEWTEEWVDEIKAWLIAHKHNRGLVTAAFVLAQHDNPSARNAFCLLHKTNLTTYNSARNTVRGASDE